VRGGRSLDENVQRGRQVQKKIDEHRSAVDTLRAETEEG